MPFAGRVKMAALVDDNNQPISLVTRDNLQKFQQYLLEVKDANEHLVRIDPSLTLDDILIDSNGRKLDLSDAQYRFLARDLVYSEHSENLVKDLINTAEEHPALIANVYTTAGHSSYSPLYESISQELSKRSFEDNLPIIYAMITTNGNTLISSFLGTGTVTKLSPKNQRYVDDLFNIFYSGKNNMYAFARNDNPYVKSAAESFFKDTAVSKFLNYEQASSEFRSFITEQIFYSPSNITHLLDALNEKFYDKELLGKVLQSKHISVPTHVIDTSKAVTQQQKNANIFPSHYRKIMSAMLKITKKENPHNYNNYGREKSLTQRYLDMCKEIAPKCQNSQLFNSGLLMIAQNDIINGNAAKLDAEVLQMVIKNDKHNYYLRKIPENIIAEKHLEISPKNTIITKLQNREKLLEQFGVMDIVTRKNLSLQEKQDLIKAAESKLNNQASLYNTLQERLENYEKDKQALNEQYKQVEKNNFVADAINKLQQKFHAIQTNFKNGIPNAQEAFLNKEMVEKHISAYIKGDKKELKLPEQKSLPLLIGRKEEQLRRNNLDAAIRGFNEELKNIVINSQRAFKTAFPDQERYNGIILSDKAKEMAEAQKQDSVDKLKSQQQDFNRDYKTITDTQITKSEIDRQKENLSKAKEHLANHHNKLSKLSKERLGINSNTKIEKITQDMTPEQKHEARLNNQRQSDKLEQKAQEYKGLTDTQKVQKTMNDIKSR